jgi:hypothetical protein
MDASMASVTPPAPSDVIYPMRAPRSWNGLREISIIRDRLRDARRQPRLFIWDCYQPSLSGNAPTEGLFRYHMNKQHATIDKHVGHDRAGRGTRLA